MNIALFASAFYPHFGGVEEHVRQLAHQYKREGHSVIIVTNRWPRHLPVAEQYEGLSIYRLPFRVPEGGLKTKISYALTHSTIMREMAALLRKHKIDIINVQCISSNGYYALLARRALRLPLVISAHAELTMDAGRLYQRSPFQNSVLRDLLREADFVTGCSAKTLSDLEKHTGIQVGTRSKVIFSGVNVEDFARGATYAHPHPYILAIGRMVSQKGFDALIDAYAQVTPTTHDLIFAGDGPERSNLEQQAQKKPVSDHIHFLGRADRSRAVELFNGASFVVLPSRADEGLPVVILEAMAAGKAIIASEVGGIPEIVAHEETGLLVSPGNTDALAQAVHRLASEPALSRQLGRAGLLRVQPLTWANMAGEYLEMYHRLL